MIIAAILLLAGLALGAVVFAKNGFDLSKLRTTVYEKKTYDVLVDFTGIEAVSKETDIALKRSETGAARVECMESDKVKYFVGVESGVLRITVDDSRSWADRIGFFTNSRTLTVYLPAESYERLMLNVGTGDVSIPGGFTFGSAYLKTSTGDVRFEAAVDEALTVLTGTGDITLSGASAGSMELSVSTGRVKLDSCACAGEISVSVSTGDVHLANVTCESFISNGTTGHLTLKNTAASGTISIERSTGDVRFEMSDAHDLVVKTTTGDVTGSLLTEKIFSAHASTGDVSVPASGSGGRCEISTTTGDIRISIAG